MVFTPSRASGGKRSLGRRCRALPSTWPPAWPTRDALRDAAVWWDCHGVLLCSLLCGQERWRRRRCPTPCRGGAATSPGSSR
ncbi:hypothetical protein I4F81_005371 [Pyropia yezoensis]|uniref:Uncharacterized protein n=1 Tax=Pyropia yezoensis TaxID=2788 RepID=A0ACC3BXS3_PYRYE|nr:hypothetical protein I4F81_005371 [Neopyropia yezoensis]